MPTMYASARNKDVYTRNTLGITYKNEALIITYRNYYVIYILYIHLLNYSNGVVVVETS